MRVEDPIIFGASCWFSLEVYDRVIVHGWSAFAFCAVAVLVFAAIGMGISKTSSRDTSTSGRVKLN